EAVPADVESVALVLVGPADPADQPGVGLEDHAGLAMPAQLVGGGQAGRTPAGDDGFIRIDDRDRPRIVHSRPAMGDPSGAYRLRLRPYPIHGPAPRPAPRPNCGSHATATRPSPPWSRGSG